MSRVLSVLKDINLARGKRNEERFFEAMNDATAKDMPLWYRFVRKPTTAQDEFEGIDAIVETSDVGQLYIQIKSSKKYAEKFKTGRHFQRNKSIIIVIIRNDDTPESIRAKTRKLLSELRQEYFKHMCNIYNK